MMRFEKVQRKALENLGLYPAQIKQLEIAVPVIKQRLRPTPVKTVRTELCKLKKAITSVEKKCLRMQSRPGGGEALTRVHLAALMKAQNPHEAVTLRSLLETAHDIVESAISGLPKSRGRIGRSSPMLKGPGELITLIFGALQTGYAAHCHALAQPQSVPPFAIRIGLNRRFSTIAGIVADVTGGWNVEEAIKSHRYNMKKMASEERRMADHWQMERRREIRAH
jgi:hypothetical protein